MTPLDKELEELKEYIRASYLGALRSDGHGVTDASATVFSDYVMIRIQSILDKTDILTAAVGMSGNEFAMGYDDSSCYWRFYAGARGAGGMIGNPEFCSESPEPLEALQEYINHMASPIRRHS